MVSRSAYLNRIVFDKRNKGERSGTLNILLNSLPGGAEIFELIVKFCYWWKVDLTANNVAPLYCAAHFLEMVNDLEEGNLISRIESFLSFIIFASWKETFNVLKSCESISTSARDLQIQRRCSEAIAWKVSTDPSAISVALEEPQSFRLSVDNDTEYSFGKKAENWWFEDVATLRIDHFIEVIASIKKKGTKSEVLGSCIACWTAKWLSRISFGTRIPTQKGANHQIRKVIVESLIRVLPPEQNSVSCNFLLHLLKLGSMVKIDTNLLSKLEKRIVLILEQCHPLDLLVKNFGEGETSFDVSIISRIVETYVSLISRDPTMKVFIIGRLVDGYLALVARDKNLAANEFRILAESVPKNSRYTDDNLYRAIDRYLKTHENLTEEERKGVCRAIEYHKLSQEAREHAMENDRLPLNIITQFILLEQVNMMKFMVDEGSNFRRTKAQKIINLKANSRRECIKVHTNMRIMKQEVETIKLELNKLQACRVEVKRLARKF